MMWLWTGLTVAAAVCGWLGILLIVYGLRVPREQQGRRKRFSVDYSGQKQFYHLAKDDYREGQMVVLAYDMIATDTRYTFLMDGKEIHPDYDEEKPYIISFRMPAHPVTLQCTTVNLMVCEES